MSLIVKVMAQHGYGVAKFILYLLYKGALAGAGAAGDAYYDYIFHMVLLLFAERCSISVLCRNGRPQIERRLFQFQNNAVNLLQLIHR